MSINTEPSYYLTYYVYSVPGTWQMHSALGISTKEAEGDYYSIARFGFGGARGFGQVLLEDTEGNLRKDNAKWGIKCRHFEINSEQLALLFSKINQDRRLPNPLSKDAKVESNECSAVFQSKPSGPRYNYWMFNCKDYVLSVFRYIGLGTKSIENLFVSIPTCSGPMETISLVREGDRERLCPEGSELFLKSKLNYYVAELQKYMTVRSANAKQYFGLAFFNGSHQSRSVKLSAASKLYNYLAANQFLELAPEEEAALKQGRLGVLYNKITQLNLTQSDSVIPTSPLTDNLNRVPEIEPRP